MIDYSADGIDDNDYTNRALRELQKETVETERRSRNSCIISFPVGLLVVYVALQVDKQRTSLQSNCRDSNEYLDFYSDILKAANDGKRTTLSRISRC